jgi:hypothetical protein
VWMIKIWIFSPSHTRSDQSPINVYPNTAHLCQSWSSWHICGTLYHVPRHDAFVIISATTTGQATRLYTLWEELLVCQCPADPWADAHRREAFCV